MTAVGILPVSGQGGETVTEDEFRAVFDSLYPDILSYAGRRTDPSTAEDVVSETFFVVWRRWPDAPETEDEKQSLRAWTFGVARNMLSNAQRAKFRASKLDTALKAAVFAGVPVVEPDHGPMVDARQAATAVFLKLPPREQELLQMVAWEGLSIDEVAEVLDTSKTAVAMRLVRARRRLAALMRAGGLATNDDATEQQLWGMRTAAQESAE
jgi:RNA polymerase sigma-70 factor, ECF subfamily